MTHNLTPSIRSHVDDHFIHWLPAVSQVQRQSEGRGFDVCLGSGCICGFEAGLDKPGAEAEAVIAGVHREDMEDWDEMLACGDEML